MALFGKPGALVRMAVKHGPYFLMGSINLPSLKKALTTK
jgi:hypothetical protein